MSTEPLRILAFDTSSQVTALAICEGSRVLIEQHLPADNQHAEVLIPTLRVALEEARITLAEIDLIGVGVGPGSFTGVRVGVATAKGLGFSLQKPVLPVVSLDALAHEAASRAEQSWIATCLDAYKGELFAAAYARRGAQWVRQLAPLHGAPELVRHELAAISGGEPLLLVGGGVARYPELLQEAPGSWQVAATIVAPKASAVAQLAYEQCCRGDVPDLASVAPLYLRGSDAQLPKRPLRV